MLDASCPFRPISFQYLLVCLPILLSGVVLFRRIEGLDMQGQAEIADHNIYVSDQVVYNLPLLDKLVLDVHHLEQCVNRVMC